MEIDEAVVSLPPAKGRVPRKVRLSWVGLDLQDHCKIKRTEVLGPNHSWITYVIIIEAKYLLRFSLM